MKKIILAVLIVTCLIAGQAMAFDVKTSIGYSITDRGNSSIDLRESPDVITTELGVKHTIGVLTPYIDLKTLFTHNGFVVNEKDYSAGIKTQVIGFTVDTGYKTQLFPTKAHRNSYEVNVTKEW